MFQDIKIEKMFHSIENEELDNIFQEVTDKIQYSIDSGKEIENIVNIDDILKTEEASFFYTSNEYSPKDKQYELRYENIYIDINQMIDIQQNTGEKNRQIDVDRTIDDVYLNNKGFLVYSVLNKMSHIYGFRNENNFPVKISYEIAGFDLNMKYYDEYIEPNDISFILAGYPLNFAGMWCKNIGYKIFIDDTIDLTYINEIKLSCIGFSIRYHNYKFLMNNPPCYIIMNNTNLNSYQLMEHVMIFMMSGFFAIIFYEQYKNMLGDDKIRIYNYINMAKYVFKSNVNHKSYMNDKTDYVLK